MPNSFAAMSSHENDATPYTYLYGSGAFLSVIWINLLVFVVVIALPYLTCNLRTKRPYPVLGDSSYWGRRLWFFSRWFQDSRNILQEGHQKVIYNSRSSLHFTRLNPFASIASKVENGQLGFLMTCSTFCRRVCLTN